MLTSRLFWPLLVSVLQPVCHGGCFCLLIYMEACVCIFRLAGGEKPAGLMKSNLTTPFRQDIPQHFAVQYRNAVGGGGQSDPLIALKDSETWRGVFKVKVPLLCIILFDEGRGSGGSCQTIEQERAHTHFSFLRLLASGWENGGNLTSRSWPSPSNLRQNKPLHPHSHSNSRLVFFNSLSC